MNLREIIISIGCCVAAVGLGLGKPARAGDAQSSNGAFSQENERCAALPPGVAAPGEIPGCERVGGHVRVDLGPRMLNPAGYGHPGASPVAVRIDDGTPRTHIRLPSRDFGGDPVPR